ncbi:hypothetical protein [Alteromonas oceanisediminis]|uniref:hypothetical protein n=1 Tax=Alteromonas oceanisediminis TaxID=2836180 RepID=UPI001BD9A821|nr:hypothetical protein [Alteromonas oceanisediminis]MBT0586994.1 hypothetical protein [Alteromonas oceanisediminis]
MTFKRTLFPLISIAVLTACGSDNDDGYDVIDDPVAAPAPAPDPVAENFPIQSETPEAVLLADVGNVFVSAEGLSLYFFANDDAGASNCNADEGAPAGASTDRESCAGRWPPLLVGEGAAFTPSFTQIERADGTYQWAYNGYPVYQFAEDSAQGDVFGDGAGDVFDLARPSPIIRFENSDSAELSAYGHVLSASNPAGEIELARLEKNGFSLYTFDNDPLDTATCLTLGDGACLNAWPPVLADNGAKPSGLFDVITQESGVTQWTFRGKPLYLFGNDNEPGDTNGQGAGDVWFLATQAPAIQRPINDNQWLTATGRVQILAPDDNGDLVSTSADKDQFSLYTFANDEPGVSNCTGGCAESWPAFLATGHDQAVGQFSIIERSDGYMQWAYQSQPLYFFSGDSAPDETNGQGAGDVWFLVPPSTTDFNQIDSPLGATLSVHGRVNTLQVDDNGEFFVQTSDKTGFQLYNFDNDEALSSNCTSSGCAANWPALLATENDEATAPFSIFQRDDGYYQWALNYKPLYFFTPDEVAGDQFGESAGDVWWVARPAPMRLSQFEDIGAGFVAHRLDIAGAQPDGDTLEGFTLYIFENDVPNSGESSCTGNCANVWPPLYAESMVQAYGDYGVISRITDDGETRYQWTYRGMPLYFFANDEQPGDANGHDVNNFFVAIPN